MITDRRETLKCRTEVVGSFKMNSSARLRSPGKVVIGIVLLAFVVVGLGVGYYFAAASTPSFQVMWSVRPLNIKFTVTQASGSAQDSFTCNPSVSPVTLQVFSSQPDAITVTVSPSAFPSCGSTPDNVTITASCTPAALANGTCPGDRYTATVQVCGPAPYTCLKQYLTVNIAVQNK